MRDLDLSAATGPHRELTQAIARLDAAYGPSVEADDHALERAMRLHRLSWEL